MDSILRTSRKPKSRIDPPPEIEWDCSLDNRTDCIIEIIDGDDNSIFVYRPEMGFPENYRGVIFDLRELFDPDIPTDVDRGLFIVYCAIKSKTTNCTLLTKSQSSTKNVAYYYKIFSKKQDAEIYLRLGIENILLDCGNIRNISEKWAQFNAIPRQLYLAKIIEHRYKIQRAGIAQIQPEDIRDLEL